MSIHADGGVVAPSFSRPGGRPPRSAAHLEVVMMSALANFSVRHRWMVLVTSLILVAGAAGLARASGGSFNDDMTLSGTDSQQAYDTLREQFPTLAGDGMQVVIHDDEGVSSPEVKGAVEAAVAEVRQQPDVAAVT